MVWAVTGRLVRGIVTLFLVAVVAWCCAEAAPGTPGERAARAAGVLPPEQGPMPTHVRQRIIEAAEREHGLLGTPLDRLTNYVGRLAAGDLGRSWRDHRPASSHISRALPVTMGLLALSLLVAYGVGVLAALLAASAPGRPRDRAVNVMVAAAVAIPPVWAAIIALRTFVAGRPWTWFPTDGFALPVLCLSYVAAAMIARHGRAALVEARALPCGVAAKARGASDRRVLLVHALALAARPLIQLLGPVLAYLLGTSLVVERAFGINGLGAMTLDAASVGDAPLVIAGTLMAGTVIFLATLLGDVIGVLADKRDEGAGPTA